MEDPSGGSIIFQGEDIADMKVDINAHREKIGMVFQQFNLFNNKTVVENIMLAPVYVGLRNIKRIKRKNLAIKFKNLFRKEKQELIELNETPQQIKSVLCTFVFAKSRIFVSSFQYLTSSNGIVSTGAPVIIIPSKRLFFISEKLL